MWLLVLALGCGPSEPPAPPWRVASATSLEGPFHNRLAGSTSPYLASHADQPVDWYPWSDEAFAEARRRNVPIFLSIGYSSCHWCHVMAEESFSDPRVAAFLNEHFVAIKVDREERPDVDALYLDAVTALTGGAGWPASLWLTPDGRPFYAGTYFPPEPRSGRPSFRDVLIRLDEAWATRPADLTADAARLTDDLARLPTSDPELAPVRVAADQTFAALKASWIPDPPGWGRRRFPMAPRLEALLEAATAGDADAARIVGDTLRAMDQGGLHDVVGGGFHRYTVDDAWTIPHFEQMLVDQAQLVGLYAEASVVLGDPRFAAVSDEVAVFVERELGGAHGAFASGLDADSGGVEGAFTTWTDAELTAALRGPLPPTLRLATDPSLDGRGVLVRTEPEPLDDAARARLFEVRSSRVRPRTDTKEVVAYNGLAISGFAKAGRLLGRSERVTTARRVAEVVLTARAPDGSLPRTLDAGAPPAVLDDYGAVAVGLLDLYEATGEARWLVEARALVDVAEARFGDPARGGWFHAGDDLVVRSRIVEDGPEPSGYALLTEALWRLDAYGDDRRPAREAALRGAGPALRARGAPSPGVARVARRDGVTTLVVSAPDRDAATPFVAAWSASWRPGGALAVVVPGEVPPTDIFRIFDGKEPGDVAVAYLCRDGVCRQPEPDVDRLRADLGG